MIRVQTKAWPAIGENVKERDLINISEVELIAHGL